MFLKVDKIHTFLGQCHILYGVSLDIVKGEVVALLGRNGVGKSTTIKSIIGLCSPQSGSIRFKGEEIVGLRPYKISQLGIGYVPEERRIFSNLTVRQNLMIGMNLSKPQDNSFTIEKIYNYFPQLEKRDRVKGRYLSGGEQQMLTIARTLMGNPELLLLDEPTEGLSPLLVETAFKVLRQINDNGGTILIVTQALDITIKLASQFYVMAKGEVVFGGTKEQFQADEDVRIKYLEV